MKPSRRFAINATLCGLLLWPLVTRPSICHANDSAFSGVSGTPKPLKGEHRSIVMQSEKVAITANGDNYDTVVDFIFRNDGPATSVQMGFPESSYGDVEATKKTTFLSFATYVDGRKVEAKRIVTSGSDADGGVEAFWLKTVTFGARKSRRIRVAYRSPMGGTTEWGVRNALTYDFTGKNWKGKVDRSDLEVRIAKPGLWIGYPKFDNKPIAMTLETTPKEAVFRKTWRNWEAQGYFMFGLTPAVPFWMMDRTILGADTILKATTFRVGPVPSELPVGAEAPHAFKRDDVIYISLSHLQTRLSYFQDDLAKYRNIKVDLNLAWNPATRVATLRAGRRTFKFSPETPVFDSGKRPILLDAQYGKTLYVPLAAVSKALGLEYTIDSSLRLFEIRRGTWNGQ
ncbi:hypothetical protein EON80_09365 [bacterium]|nr:MAG: hypothetical protein EON80_09365 [bacterium]